LVDKVEKCDLCGLRIDGKPVVRTFDGEEKHFCCEGCARVYEVARENNMLDQVLPALKPASPRLTDTLLDRGQTSNFSLSGMWCPGCAQAAQEVLRRQLGVKDVDVSFAAERGRIRYDPEQVDPAAVLKKLDSLGYRARLLGDPGVEGTERQQERTLLQLLTAAGFGMQVMLIYLVQLYPLYAAGQFDNADVRKLQYVSWALATPVLLVGGSSFIRGAWRALRARTATMDTLVALGTVSAYSYSAYVTVTGGAEAYFDSVAMITTFIMLGRYLESLGGTQARKDIRRLLKLQPDNAWKRVDGEWQEVQAKTLLEGDEILVKPGARVPADAEILEGQGAVDESLLTGESAPVNKEPGDTAFAGTVVTNAALIARVTHAIQETRLAQVTALVEQTLATKPPIQRLADKAAAYFAFGILTAATLTACGWYVAGFGPSRALLAAVAVLVVACPCALGLATPLALTVTLGQTSQAGILVRNPVALETAARIQRVVFDKTGTLTLGRMAVAASVIDPERVTSEEELLCLAAAVEQYSEHPVAKAIVGACSNPLLEAREFQALGGLGASARVPSHREQRVLVGSLRFLNVDGHSRLADQAQAHAERGETVVWVGWDSALAGFIALRDEPNSTAPEALHLLQDEGIRPVMLSGDNPLTTQSVADELGLSEYEGNCPPQEKAARIQGWQATGEQVAMVGDGVNDAPALAQADLSITTVGGTDVAGETSDVVLTRSDLTSIPWFTSLSRRTRRIILENLGWAFAYNLVSVPLAALGLISPVIAAGAMATSSLLVVGNSLRLRR
jgi:heavy metal translocating P-type ATPase